MSTLQLHRHGNAIEAGSSICQLSYRRRQIEIQADWKTYKQTDRHSKWIRLHTYAVQTSAHIRERGTGHDDYVNSFTKAERCAMWLLDSRRHSLLCHRLSTLSSPLFRQFVLITFFCNFFSYYDFFLSSFFLVWNSPACDIQFWVMM